MDFPIISRCMAEELALKNDISLTEAKKLLELTAIRVLISDDVEPIYDNDGFFLGTRTKVKLVEAAKSNKVKWGNPWSLSLEELFDQIDD